MNIRCVCALLVTHLALDSMRKDCHICVRVFTLFSLHCIVLLCLLTSDQARCSDILSVHRVMLCNVCLVINRKI